MQLTQAHVRVYKSIDDSGPVPVEPDVTVLVGQNESGKTAFLEALHKAHPVDDAAVFDVTEDYPRKALNKYLRQHEKDPAVAVELGYRLADTEVAEINDELGFEAVKPGFEFKRTVRYGGGSTITIALPEKAYVKHLLKGVELPSEVKKAAADSASMRDLLRTLEEADLNEEATAFREKVNARFGKAPEKWHSALAWWVWRNLLEDRVPRFIYFDDYMLLPGKVNLDKLRKDADNEPSQEDKTVLALLRMAGVDLDELIATKGYEEVKARLEGLGNTITDQVFEYWKQNRELDVEFDIREDPTDESPFDSGPNLYIRIKNRRHRVTVPFSQRSKGFIWFFSFLVWFDSVKEQAETSRDLILLLDEPGLSLHALGQADLLRYVDDLAEKHQVVYTTHSPFMVRGARLHQVRVVEDRVAEGTKVSDNVSSSDPGTLFPLQAALGYDIAQNLFISKRNLLVEGPADLVYLKYVSAELEAKGRTALRDDVVVTPTGGLDKLVTFVALLGANQLELAVLHDSVGRPDQRIQSAVRDKLIADKQVITYGQFVGAKQVAGPGDIEDLITPAKYLALFGATYSKELDGREIREADLPNGDRIVDRINRFLEAEGLQVRPSGGFNHYRVANQLASQAKLKLDAPSLKRFEALFEHVNGLFSPG